jgi:hypothetical protein
VPPPGECSGSPTDTIGAVARRTRIVLVVVLLVAAAWTTLAVVTAVARGEGEGGVFWSAIGLLVAIAVGLMWTAARVARWRSGR